MQCKICSFAMVPCFEAYVLNKYDAEYMHCKQCGLIQARNPFWLNEAYGEAIAKSDTGLVRRNFSIALKLASLIYFELDPYSAYLDLAGGYGMLTRLMRDFGFNFYWSDKYCNNLMARGFEYDKANKPFSALTAFEVLEHVHDPFNFISEALVLYNTRTFIFSTVLYQGEPPAKNWWYYAFESGQHISFYKYETLQIIAHRLGLNLYSANGIHMFSDKSINKMKFKQLTSWLAYLFAAYVKTRLPSLTVIDHHRMIQLATREQREGS